jgi:probable F420-dependent oxidoreductase
MSGRDGLGVVPPLGRVGIWSAQLRFGDPEEGLEAAAELDALGFGTLWIPDAGGPVLERVRQLLGATTNAAVATGILNVWMHDPADVARDHAAIDADFPGRFLLGIGISHAPMIDADEPGKYRKPLETMGIFLDGLDAHRVEGHRPARVLAALGPKMLQVARERSLGVHPYLIPVAHTRFTRETLGPDAVIAASLTVICDDDTEKARAIARNDMETYLGLPNYVTVWRRLGWGDDDFAGNGTDEFIDAIYAYGSLDAIAARIAEHHDAGADHICIRVVTDAPDDPTRLPREQWRYLGGLFER